MELLDSYDCIFSKFALSPMLSRLYNWTTTKAWKWFRASSFAFIRRYGLLYFYTRYKICASVNFFQIFFVLINFYSKQKANEAQDLLKEVTIMCINANLTLLLAWKYHFNLFLSVLYLKPNPLAFTFSLFLLLVLRKQLATWKLTKHFKTRAPSCFSAMTLPQLLTCLQLCVHSQFTMQKLMFNYLLIVKKLSFRIFCLIY